MGIQWSYVITIFVKETTEIQTKRDISLHTLSCITLHWVYLMKIVQWNGMTSSSLSFSRDTWAGFFVFVSNSTKSEFVSVTKRMMWIV